MSKCWRVQGRGVTFLHPWVGRSGSTDPQERGPTRQPGKPRSGQGRRKTGSGTQGPGPRLRHRDGRVTQDFTVGHRHRTPSRNGGPDSSDNPETRTEGHREVGEGRREGTGDGEGDHGRGAEKTETLSGRRERGRRVETGSEEDRPGGSRREMSAGVPVGSPVFDHFHEDPPLSDTSVHRGRPPGRPLVGDGRPRVVVAQIASVTEAQGPEVLTILVLGSRSLSDTSHPLSWTGEGGGEGGVYRRGTDPRESG